jgi:hypothetical protein
MADDVLINEGARGITEHLHEFLDYSQALLQRDSR